MKKILLSTVVCASMMFAANSDYKYEITPMVGGVYTEGNLDLFRNYANAGLAVGFNQTDSFIDQIELGFLRTIEDVGYYKANKNDTGITRIFTNFIKEYPFTSDLSAYALIGAGVEFFDEERKGNESGLFGNYGLGLKYKLAEQFALKFDVRHAIETDHGDNNLLYNVGLAMPFGKVAKAAPVAVQEPVVEAPKDSDNDGVIDANDQCPNTVAGAVVDANGCELDDDNDGVVNRLDQCPNTIEGAQVDNVGCMTLVNLNINFETNSAKIKEGYNSRLEAFANMMNNNKMLKATIEGHTDSIGSAKYNQKLSNKRAISTVNALKALNVDVNKLKAVGYGETRPVASNKTAEGRAENRRVTAVINK